MTVRAALIVLVAAFAVGCGAEPPPYPQLIAVEGWPRGPLHASGRDAVLVPKIPLGLEPRAPYVVCVRARLDAGVAEIAVARGADAPRIRRVSAIGESLTIVPVGPGDEDASLTIRSGVSGRVELEVEAVGVGRVSPESASSSAALIAREFEEETGRLADPSVDNLVANAGFAADDEVRGTPADWFAYVETDVDPVSQALTVRGAAPDGRPFLATGPMRVAPRRRYRATVRIAVDAGAVVVRVVDYDELSTIAERGPIGTGTAAGDVTFEFVAPPNARAVRLRFDPSTPAEPAAFRLTTAQVELLPPLAETASDR